jgi:hypothetical protein
MEQSIPDHRVTGLVTDRCTVEEVKAGKKLEKEIGI